MFMDLKTVIVCLPTGKKIDVEIPLDIPCEELARSLWEALKIPGEPGGFLWSENPTALLCGPLDVRAYGIHEGTIIHIGGAR